MKKRILVITPTYPPYQGSHTERMTALVNSLKENGFVVGVLTTEVLKGNTSYNPKLDTNFDPDVFVYRAPFGFLHRRSYERTSSYTSIKYGNSNDPNLNIDGLSVKRKVVRFIEQIKKRVLIPDSLIDWYFSAIKYVKQDNIISEFSPDIIMSCSMPNTCHLIGYKLAKKYHLDLAMDIADPWVYISYYQHGKIAFLLEKSIESKILKYSRLISFSTKGCQDLYIEKYNLPKHKVVTVVTGYNEDLLTLAQSVNNITSEEKTDSINMIYGGALQVGGRDPVPFIQAVASQENNIQFFLRTDNVSFAKALLPKMCNNIQISEYAPFDVFFQEMLSSDVLVFFGNATADQLPGKIFNYIPTGKLIFYISSVEDESKDQAISIVKDYGKYVISSNNVQSIIEGLKKIIEIKKKGLLDKQPENQNIVKYSSKNQFGVLSDLIKHL